MNRQALIIFVIFTQLCEYQTKCGGKWQKQQGNLVLTAATDVLQKEVKHGKLFWLLQFNHTKWKGKKTTMVNFNITQTKIVGVVYLVLL